MGQIQLIACTVYPWGQFLPKQTRALIDCIADHCGDEPYWDIPLTLEH